MVAIAVRVHELLGGRSRLIADFISVPDVAGRFLCYVSPLLSADRWELTGFDGGRIEWIDLPASTWAMQALGVETMARGLVAAIKRHEREQEERLAKLAADDPPPGVGIPVNDREPTEAEIDAAYDRYANGRIGTGRDGQDARPIRDARGLLISIGDHLAGLGLEPDLGGDTLTFTFLGAVHRLELENLELRRPGPTAEEMAIRAAGLPV